MTRQQYDTQRATVAQDQAIVQSDQAQIDAAKLNVAYCEITPPIDGVTRLRLVDIGNLVQASAGTPLVTVTQIKPIYVTFTVPERDLERIPEATGRLPADCGTEGFSRDWRYDRLDHRLADRRFHTVIVYGRHRRAPLPRIRSPSFSRP